MSIFCLYNCNGNANTISHQLHNLMKNTAENQRITIKLCPKYAYVIDNGVVYKTQRSEWMQLKAKGLSDKEAALKVIENNPIKRNRRETINVNI